MAMDKPDKSLFNAFSGRALMPAKGVERVRFMLKTAGRDTRARHTEGGDIAAARKQALAKNRKEIKDFKQKESKEDQLERLNFFLEREEENMRALWRKRRR